MVVFIVRFFVHLILYSAYGKYFFGGNAPNLSFAADGVFAAGA
jgi:hypothetical protein